MGLGFLFQWNELDFPRGMALGTYPLASGTLYLFSAFEVSQPKLDRLEAFWQRA
jgi:hypothetical protein